MMITKFALLLAPSLALSFALAGCSGGVKVTKVGDPDHPSGSLVHITNVNATTNIYMVQTPENMDIVLPGGDWRALQMFKDADGEVVTFYRDSGRVSVSVSTSTEKNLRKEFLKNLTPSDTDSLKLIKMLEWSTSELDSIDFPDGQKPNVVVSSARHGHVCMTDSARNYCSFIVHTGMDNWVFADVVTPKEESAEELGTRVLSKVNMEKGRSANRKLRKFKSTGLGMSIWYNWEDEDLNPDRDFSRAILLRRSGLLDFGSTLALNYTALYGFNPGDAWHNWGWRFMLLFGFRLYGVNAFVSPFFGAQIGLGMQFDDHYRKFRDEFAVNVAGSVGVGLVFCRYCKYQFELGTSFDAVDDGIFNDQVFGSFNFYAAVNY